MTRRAATATVAACLVLLATLSGGRWAISRDTIYAAHWHRPLPTAQPTSTGPGGATPTGTPSPPAPTSPFSTADQPSTRPPVAVVTGSLPKPRRTTGARGVALTFDDGPHPVWTPKILDQLRSARVHATFCLVGTEAYRYPGLVARIVREGHTLCNHSWHHEMNLGTLPTATIRANLDRTNRAIHRAVPGAPIRYFRHPGGKWTPAAIKVARDLGMSPLHWSVDPWDWAEPGARVISTRVLGQARSGSIVLLHDGGGDRSGTVAACPVLLTGLKRKYGVLLLK